MGTHLAGNAEESDQEGAITLEQRDGASRRNRFGLGKQERILRTVQNKISENRRQMQRELRLDR